LHNVDIFPFDGSPKPFRYGVIKSPAFTVHTDPDAILFQCINIIRAGELANTFALKYIYIFSAPRLEGIPDYKREINISFLYHNIIKGAFDENTTD
jgi:hypothetical protein